MSCADEIVAKLLLAAANGDRVMVLAGVREEQREALEHVLAHHRLAVAACFRGLEEPRRPRLDQRRMLGWCSPSSARAGRPTRLTLAGRLGWSVERAAVALDELTRTGSRGRSPAFSIP